MHPLICDIKISSEKIEVEIKELWEERKKKYFLNRLKEKEGSNK